MRKRVKKGKYFLELSNGVLAIFDVRLMRGRLLASGKETRIGKDAVDILPNSNKAKKLIKKILAEGECIS